MAKAKIISEQGEGEYVIQPIYDIARAESRLASLISEIAEIDVIINALDVSLVAVEAQRSAAIIDLNAAIDNANANTDNNQEFTKQYAEILASYTKEITDININLVKISDLIAVNYNHKSSKLVERKGIDDSFTKYKNPLNQSAWCADYTEGLTGDVGIISINDETNAPNDQDFIIDAEGIESDTRDIQPVISSGSMAIAYNLAVMPAFQKWKPRYRGAVISTIDNAQNTCRVSFSTQYQKSSILGEFRASYNIFQGQAIDNAGQSH